MATKKRSKKTSKSKGTARGKASPKKLARKARTPKKSAKKKVAQNKSVAKKKDLGKRAIRGKSANAAKRNTRKKSQGGDALAPFLETPTSRLGEQSGDLQGLSNVESADSESVDELIEEGNAFEAGVVDGVEEAGDRGEREVHTREVPEDDVPGEYLDED
jgi:hypothetical protein